MVLAAPPLSPSLAAAQDMAAIDRDWVDEGAVAPTLVLSAAWAPVPLGKITLTRLAGARRDALKMLFSLHQHPFTL